MSYGTIRKGKWLGSLLIVESVSCGKKRRVANYESVGFWH